MYVLERGTLTLVSCSFRVDEDCGPGGAESEFEDVEKVVGNAGWQGLAYKGQQFAKLVVQP